MLRNFQLRTLVVAGFLLFMPFIPLSGGASAALAKPQSKQPGQEQKQEKRARGRRHMADGQIKDVTCKGRALDMAFDDSDKILRLHTDDYFKVDFSAINFTPGGTMNPCKTVKGMYARVYYYRIEGHPREGELISVELRK
jgi:hypothetical protein